MSLHPLAQICYVEAHGRTILLTFVPREEDLEQLQTSKYFLILLSRLVAWFSFMCSPASLAPNSSMKHHSIVQVNPLAGTGLGFRV